MYVPVTIHAGYNMYAATPGITGMLGVAGVPGMLGSAPTAQHSTYTISMVPGSPLALKAGCLFVLLWSGWPVKDLASPVFCRKPLGDERIVFTSHKTVSVC